MDTLRHSYATTMLEAGTNLKVLQTFLGHKTLQATEAYLHLTRNSNEHARRVVDELMNGPPQASDDAASDNSTTEGEADAS